MGSLGHSIMLNSGYSMPQVGLGTWLSKPGEVTAAVKKAIEVGYRHIDCAWMYENEREVGAGLKECFDAGLVERKDVFVTSKLWNTFHRHQDVKPSLKETLSSLGLDYLDLYLMHWPMAFKEGGGPLPVDDNGKFIYSNTGYMEAWKAMEECVKDGLVRSIGLSNFNSQQIQEVIDKGTTKPAVNQVEVHAYHSQRPLVEFCHNLGVAVTAYSPLANPTMPWKKEGAEPKLVNDPKLATIATRVGRTPAQVLLRALMQRNLIVIPKSVTPCRIEENFKVFDFELSDQDMSTIASFNRDARGCTLEWASDHPHYPFNIPA